MSEAIVPKSYPNTKTIILREEDTASKTDPLRPGVWNYNLNEEIILKDGDEVLIKSSYIDTQPDTQGLINITQDEIDQLSITTGLYWSNAGNGVNIERYQDVGGSPGPTYTAINYKENGPLPLQSQVLLSEDPDKTPDAKNYICQNVHDDFTNTIIYLNTGTAQQTTSGGAVNGIISPPGGTGSLPGTAYSKGTNLSTLTVTGNGTNLTVDILAVDTNGVPTSIAYGNHTGQGYAIGDVFAIIQPNAAGGTNQSARTTVSSISASTGIQLELVPNPAYDPTKPTHEYSDYTLQNAANITTPYLEPTSDPTDLIKVDYLCNLKLVSNPDDPSLFYLFSARFSGQPGQGKTPHNWTQAPNGTTNHIATLSISLINNEPTWSVTKNDSWDFDKELPGGNSPPEMGWIFPPAVAGTNITFNTRDRAGLYRICLGMWLWVWFPNAQETDNPEDPNAWPSVPASGTVNNYNLTLHYYEPGTVEGSNGAYTASKPAQISKDWVRSPDKKGSDRFTLNPFYQAQFPTFANLDRAGFTPFNKPDSGGFDAPVSQFPTVGPAVNKLSVTNYPTVNGGTFVPCWFGNMPDTSSDSPVARNFTTFPEFVYDANPSISVGSKDPDAKNFAPFRVLAADPWQDAKPKMLKGYETGGIAEQDARGPVKRNTASGKPDYPPVPTEIPPYWTQGSDATHTTAAKPPYKLTHSCVLSKPYIPGGAKHMTARTFTTKLIDIPGVETTLVKGTYTYEAWARLLTDTLNRVPKSRASTLQGGTGGLPNNPDNSNIALNKPTYSQSRIMTDTVQLGYQGYKFPSNRVGLNWNTNQGNVDAGNVVANYDDNGAFVSYGISQQPYWVNEEADSLFAWKDSLGATAVKQDVGGEPVEYATVDPQPPATTSDGRTFTNNAYSQEASVYGENGPKWAGAESFSIIFNETSQAFEIVQMHSNLYDAASGAIITRQFRSGTKGEVYPQEIGELYIADQSGGVFITDWQPKELWQTKMQFSANTLVSTGGDFSSNQNYQVNSFAESLKYPDLDNVSANKVNLVRGTNITGNYRSVTSMVNKRVNIPTASSQTPSEKIANLIGGNFASCPINFDLQTETQTPVTIVGKTIVPGTILDPFFMIELTGINRNEIYGLPQNNKLISQVVGRYYTTASYTEGSSDGSITYVHRGEDMMISELGIRILDSAGGELTATDVKNASAVIIQINGTDVSLIDSPSKK